MEQNERDLYQELSDKDHAEYVNQLNSVGTVILENESISDSAVHLELYREFATNEINNGNDFPTFSEWKELNREVLS